jgi:hypothetical protein
MMIIFGLNDTYINEHFLHLKCKLVLGSFKIARKYFFDTFSKLTSHILISGGRKRGRTSDLMHVKHAL